MPHGSLKIIPGVDTNRTPALNEAAVSQSNLMRFFPDRQNAGLAQKIGGWKRFITGTVSSGVIRALKGWQDLDNVDWLGIGSEGESGLQAYDASQQLGPYNVTPRFTTNDFTPGATSGALTYGITTSAGSDSVVVTSSLSPSVLDWVYFPTQINVGNLLLYGPYQVSNIGTNNYTINVNATLSISTISRSGTTVTVTTVEPHRFYNSQSIYIKDVDDNTTFPDATVTITVTSGNPYVFTYTSGASGTASSFGGTVTPAVTNGGTPPQFTTTNASSSVRVTLYNHNLVIGDDFEIPISTTVGGITLLGVYSVVGLVDENNFTIRVSGIATSAASGYENGGDIRQNLFIAISASTDNANFYYGGDGSSAGTYGSGVYSTGGSVTVTTSGNGTTATVTFTPAQVIPIGTSITISGVTPSAYNSAPGVPWVVTASSSGSVSFLSSATGSQVTAGSISFSSSVTTGSEITATDWSLDTWGQILVSNPVGGSIFYWIPSGGEAANAVYMPNAPLFNESMFVAMPQRQIVALGSTDSTFQDPLLVRWCDVEDFTVWQGTANNLAGKYRIPTGSRIVGGIQAAQQGLIWTDLDLWAMQFIGFPGVYGFNKVGSNAGLIGRKAMGQLAGSVYWMSQKQFFRFAGQGAELLPCPVWDQVFQNIYESPTTGIYDANGALWTDRIRCCPNTQFNEIIWYFPAAQVPILDSNGLPAGGTVAGTGEVNAYVKYNISLNQWDFGYQDPSTSNVSNSVIVARTAWIDQSVLGPPLGAATSKSITPASPGYAVFQHETSNDAEAINGTTIAIKPNFQTGYFALSEGDQQLFIDQVWPDMKWGTTSGDQDAVVYITFYVVDYPGDPPVAFGPYTMTKQTEYLSVRMRGRLVSISVSSTDLGSFWRLGNIRYRFQPDGKY